MSRAKTVREFIESDARTLADVEGLELNSVIRGAELVIFKMFPVDNFGVRSRALSVLFKQDPSGVVSYKLAAMYGRVDRLAFKHREKIHQNIISPKPKKSLGGV